MPGSFLTADTSFPTFTAGQSTDEKISVVTNYLYMLLEQLRYTMANLGTDNFNDAELNGMYKEIREPILVQVEELDGRMVQLKVDADGISARVTGVEGNVAQLRIDADTIASRVSDVEGNLSTVEQYAKGIRLSVENGDESSTLTLTSNGTVLSSETIIMNGVVEFVNAAKNGTSTVIDGGAIYTDTLNLTGHISFSDLSDACVRSIDARIPAGYTPPKYIKSTYIDSAEIRSPKILANVFEVRPLDEEDLTGSYDIYGMQESTRGMEQYHMFTIKYHGELYGYSPRVYLYSPMHARIYFGGEEDTDVYDANYIYFVGHMDFSKAIVDGLHATYA